MPRSIAPNPRPRVDVWEERDNLQITLYDGTREVATWTDDDARQMFEDGFFERGRKLESSVIEYAREMGMIPARNRRHRIVRKRAKTRRRARRNPGRESYSLPVNNLAVKWFQGYASDIRYTHAKDGTPYSHVVETDAAEIYLCDHPEFGHCILIVNPRGDLPLWK